MDNDKLQKLKNTISCLFDSEGKPDYDCLSEILFFDSEDQGNVVASIPVSAVQSMVHYLIEHDKLEEVLTWNNNVFSKSKNSLGDFTEDEFVQFDSLQSLEDEELYEIDERYDYDEYGGDDDCFDNEDDEPVIH